MWAPDRREVIKHHRVTFSKHEKWGSESLNISIATLNVLSDRRSIDRPRKSSSPFKLLASDFVVTNRHLNSHDFQSDEQHDFTCSNDDAASISMTNDAENKNEDAYSDDQIETDELTAESTVQTRAKLAALTTSPRMIKQFLHVTISKRKREAATDEEERDEHRDKIARAMMTLLIQELDETDSDEWALAAGTSNKANRQFINRLVIPVPESYEDAINDPIWGKL